jgi:hypothetical protein
VIEEEGEVDQGPLTLNHVVINLEQDQNLKKEIESIKVVDEVVQEKECIQNVKNLPN